MSIDVTHFTKWDNVKRKVITKVMMKFNSLFSTFTFQDRRAWHLVGFDSIKNPSSGVVSFFVPLVINLLKGLCSIRFSVSGLSCYSFRGLMILSIAILTFISESVRLRSVLIERSRGFLDPTQVACFHTMNITYVSRGW